MDVTQDHHNYNTSSFIKKIEQQISAISTNKYCQSTGVFLLILLSIKLLVTFGTVFIYAKVTPFNDVVYYLNQKPAWDLSLIFHRTLFTEYVFSILKFLLHYDIFVHCFVSISLGLVLWFVIKPDYKYINKFLLFSCLALPHFLIWTGIVGKEAIAIVGFLLIIRACIDLVVWNQYRFVLLIIGLFLALIERPHYSIAYIYLLIASLIFVKNKKMAIRGVSLKKNLLLFSSFLILLIIMVIVLEPLYANSMSVFMEKIKKYFFIFPSAHTTRTAVLWSNATDFFANMTWGIPISIIGPTLYEAIKRLILLPVFIEGCCALTLVLTNTFLLFRLCKKSPNYTSLIIWGFLPALIMGLIINYPFGLFNPGSAIRYKQSLAPLFYFYPILLIATIRKKEYNANPKLKN